VLTWTFLPMAAEGRRCKKDKGQASIVRSPLRACEKVEPHIDAHGRPIFFAPIDLHLTQEVPRGNDPSPPTLDHDPRPRLIMVPQ
jgi:hypothetical protein